VIPSTITRLSKSERYAIPLAFGFHKTRSHFPHALGVEAFVPEAVPGAWRSSSATYWAVYSGKECPIHFCNRVIEKLGNARF
jgi:hypothetical protein